MGSCGAPAERGFKKNGYRLVGRFGLPAIALWGVLTLGAVYTPVALGTTNLPESAQRHLLVAPDPAKPLFALADLDGSLQALEANAGQIVLVHFFATWCEPCREELSSLSKLAARSPSQLSILAINVAEVPVRVRRFLESSPVNFPVLLDTNRAVTKAWGVSTLPTTFVLDRQLTARLFVEGDVDWQRADVLAALEQIGAATK